MSEERAQESEILHRVRTAATVRSLFLPHALSQMNAPERMITPQDVRDAVLRGSLVEDYPEDARGHSCLGLGYDSAGRPIHVVCAPKADYLAINTANVPSPDRWELDGRIRRKGD